MKPVVINTTDMDGGQAMIRLVQPGNPESENENLRETSWEKWFTDFDRNRLAPGV